jgi:uncharacterized protein (TIGR01777 family)
VRVVLTGGSGLLGRALGPALSAAGHDVVALVRRTPGPGEARWDPAGGMIDSRPLEGADAVVHLAGAGIGDRRWSPARKAEILGSRVGSTDLLARTLAGLEHPPAVMASASAVGWYGNRGDEVLTEESGPGEGFLASVCRAWEEAADPARAAGVRVAHLRSGVVLARTGGALAKQLRLFKMGLGGRLGDGRQWLSWIALDDEIAAILHVLSDAALAGPVNLSAPAPVTNATFTRALGGAVHRPAVARAPRLALRVALGTEMADELLFAGQRVMPARLLEAGFAFGHGDIDGALASVLAS